MRELIKFLEANFPNGVQMFNTRNTVGDEMRTVFCKCGITVDLCDDWGYIEIFGLTDDQFDVISGAYDGEPLWEIPNIPTII